MVRNAILVALGLVLADGDVALAQNESFRIFGGSIRVDRSSHWNDWVLQNDMVSTLKTPAASSGMFRTNTKGISPTYWRRKINVAPDAVNFSYQDYVRAGAQFVDGGASALSNDRIAGNLIDDDLSTYWEPATPTSYSARLANSGDFSVARLRNWEIELDLGRLVFADSVSIVFPAGQFGDEFLGQPVKSFALFASMGERFPFPLGNNFRFTLIGQLATGDIAKTLQGDAEDEEREVRLVAVPGTEGRYAQATFVLEPLTLSDLDDDGRHDVSGTFVQYIRLTVTDSDLWRDDFIGKGEDARLTYEELPAAQRGALVYQRRTAGGFLVELEDEAATPALELYNSLPESKRGSILYYKKEVPRVSEILVWAKGDNYALRPETRAGGTFENGGLGDPSAATDGVYDTQWDANTWSPIYRKGTAWWDLGAVFWVDNLFSVNKRVGTYTGSNGAFLGPNFLVSDGTLLNSVKLEKESDFDQLEDALQWDNIVPEALVDNRSAKARILNIPLELRKIRFLQVRDLDVSGTWSGRYGSVATPAEIHLYGEGYPVSVWVYSPPIKLTDSRGNFIRKTLPKIAWQAEAIVRETDPETGLDVERYEALELHPDVRVSIQTRTSDQTDSAFTYYEVVDAGGEIAKQEIGRELHDDLIFRWRVWNAWEALATPHKSKNDDDGDGSIDEDPINFEDDDGDGLIDEDGKKLGRGKKPKSTAEKIGELTLVGWSEWSDSYQPTNGRNEAIVSSPNPRKFIQIRVNMASETPSKTARVNSVRIDLAPPLALEVAGELAVLSETGMGRLIDDLSVESLDYQAPSDVDPLQSHIFSYFIRASQPDPADATVQSGFDELLIVTPQATELEGVRFGLVDVSQVPTLLDPTVVSTRAVSSRFDTYFRRADGDSLFRAADGQVLQVIPTTSDSLWIRLPFAVNSGLRQNSHALVEVQFESQAFREGIEFFSFVRSSRDSEVVFQRVDTEQTDATELVESGTARVSLMTTEGSLINDVIIDRVITPNGDNANESLDVQFTLLKVNQERPVDVSFYDLSGRIVGHGRPSPAGGVALAGLPTDEEEIEELPSIGKAGVLRFSWDGRDDNGDLVPPGIYIARVRVEADNGDRDIVRTVNVVY